MSANYFYVSIYFQNLLAWACLNSLKRPSLDIPSPIWNWNNIINLLTPGAFCKKCVFWTFWWFLGWISAKLALIQWKMRLQHNSLPFLPLASRYKKVTCVVRLFDFWNFFSCLSFFSFSFLFAVVIGLLLGLLAVKKLLRKRHRDGQFLSWSSQV